MESPLIQYCQDSVCGCDDLMMSLEHSILPGTQLMKTVGGGSHNVERASVYGWNVAMLLVEYLH